MTEISPSNMKTSTLIKNLCSRARLFFERDIKEAIGSDNEINFDYVKIHISISASNDDTASAQFEAVCGVKPLCVLAINQFSISYSDSVHESLVDLSNRLEIEENKLKANKLEKAKVAIQFPRIRNWVLLYIKQCVQSGAGQPTDMWNNPMPDVSREIDGKGVMSWLNSPKHLYNTKGAIALMNAVLSRLDNT